MLIPNPQLKALPRVPRLDDDELAELTARLSRRECAALVDIAMCECRRRGLYRVAVGSKFYCAIEARVAYDIVARELDLNEIATAIEEAKWEAGCC